MSNFKNAVEKDVKAVFINPDEFADYHSLNGNQVRCIVDTDVTDAYKGGNIDGVFVNTLTIFVATEDIEPRPVEGELLELDEKTYFVRKVGFEDGIYSIVVEANEQ